MFLRGFSSANTKPLRPPTPPRPCSRRNTTDAMFWKRYLKFQLKKGPQENMDMNTVVSQFEDTVPEKPLQQSFSAEHLNLIFEMRRDVADQLHRQETLHHRLDMFFDSLSSEPEKRRCPTCCQPFTFAPVPPSSSSTDGDPGASGV
jgi:hypothetical protein